MKFTNSQKEGDRLVITVETALEMMQAVNSHDWSMFPNTLDLLQKFYDTLANRWREFGSGRFVINGMRLKSRTGSYAAGVQDPRFLFPKKGVVNVTLENTSPTAEHIENGHGPIDLKDSIRKSLKARLSKDGHAYLVVPFRHGATITPVLSQPMSKTAKNFWLAQTAGHRSMVLGQIQRESQVHPGHMVGRNIYRWGVKFTHEDAPKNEQNMYRFATERPGAKRRSSEHMTFRTLSERSPQGSWVIPMRRGAKVTEWLDEQADRKVPRIIPIGLAKDLKELERRS